MQRLALLAFGLVPAALPAQRAAGAALWRVAGQTLVVPAALADDGVAAFWNPAQTPDAKVSLGLDGVQGASAVGAAGVLFETRVRLAPVGHVALVAGRMELRDLVSTSSSPAPDGTSILYYTQFAGANVARAIGPATLGLTIARHATKLDLAESGRWVVDVGVSAPIGGSVRVAAATHMMDHLATDDAAQDLFAGVEGTLWRGDVAGVPGSAFMLRAGTAFAHGFSADYQLGAGLALGDVVCADVLAALDGSYAGGDWRPVVGVRLGVGKYRVAIAGDAGAGGRGAAFRVALEARFQ